MRLTVGLSAILLALLPALSAHAQGLDSFANAKARADADEAGLSAEAKKTLTAAQGGLVDAGIAQCATPNADVSPFVVVAELDASGKVLRTWREGSTPLAICLQKQLAKAQLPAPPTAPFFTSFELSFTP